MPTAYFASQRAAVPTQPQRRRGCASPRQGFQERWAGWGALLALAAGGEGLPAGKSSGVSGRRRNRVIYPCCGFPGGSEVKNLPVNAGDIRDVGSVLGWGRSPGGGHGNPLQYSSLAGYSRVIGSTLRRASESDRAEVASHAVKRRRSRRSTCPACTHGKARAAPQSLLTRRIRTGPGASDGSHGESVPGLSRLRTRVCQNRCLDTIRVLSSESPYFVDRCLEKGSEDELVQKSGPCLQPQTLAVGST